MAQLKYYNSETGQWEPAVVGKQGDPGLPGPTGPIGPQGRYTTSDVPPALAENGDAWFDASSGRFYVYYDEYWVEQSSNMAGPVGPTGPQGVSMNFKGQIPTVAGLPSSGNLLNDTYSVSDTSTLYFWDGNSWEIAAELPVGSTGATGPSNTLTIGTVVTGPTAQVAISGTSPNQILSFTLPAGPAGADGLNGATGPSGVVSVTAPIVNSGTSSNAQLSLDSSVVTTGDAQTLTAKTFGFSFDAGSIVTTTPTPATIQFATNFNSVQYWTAALTQNFTLDFCVDPFYMQSFDSRMQVGDSMSIVAMFTNGATAYRPTAFKIDNVSVTPKWLGGTAPASGSANAVDMYTFNIVKTATNTFTVFASQAKFV